MVLVLTQGRLTFTPVSLLYLSRGFCQRDPSIHILELKNSGEHDAKTVTTHQFLSSIKKKLPLRDLRMFLRVSPTAASLHNHRKPTLVPRPSSNCYIFDIEHIRFLCYSDRCIILDPERNVMKDFVDEVISDIKQDNQTSPRFSNGNSSINSFYQTFLPSTSDFEHTVLETALSHIVRKFSRHLEIIKPALDLLLQQIEQDPNTHNLRRLLAFRKSLSEFEMSVANVMKEIQNLMSNDEDLIKFYLTKPERQISDHEELELLFEAYYADFEEIEAEIKTVKDMIEDTNQFISAHLDTVRNKMLRMSLMMEMGALALGSGAVVGGIFGMNLTSGLEEHPHAFYTALGGMGFMMTGIFAGFATKYRQLRLDTSRAHSFAALKNFFTYVDDLEYIVKKNNLNAEEFKEAMREITGLKITEEESEFIFRMFDTNKDGMINTDKELNIRKKYRED